jgi:3-methyladenine DNA glycosylase/8-oxoguanine DNA glycosylase
LTVHPARSRWTVPTPPGFRFKTTLLSHGWLQLAPFSHDEGFATLRRVHRLRDGTVVRLAVRSGRSAETEDEELEVSVAGPAGEPGPAVREEVTGAVRRIFNLDLDLSGFYELLRSGEEDRERYAWVERFGAGRLLRSPTVWEDLAKVLLTTNTTWAATRKMVERLTALGERAPSEPGEPLDAPAPARSHAFPLPERVAELDPDELSERVRAGFRSAYLHELAVEIASGRLDVEAWAAERLPARELFSRVTALKGFGPYAAGTMLKLLGSFDELALDTATRGMFARRYNDGEPASDARIRAHYQPYGAWRGLVIWVDLLDEAVGERLRSGEL